jgi:hypothetical protein
MEGLKMFVGMEGALHRAVLHTGVLDITAFDRQQE